MAIFYLENCQTRIALLSCTGYPSTQFFLLNCKICLCRLCIL
uniref:Uncharacterized protein n=1 Tax=Anopheles atroparvus TaxID=41427 RepID=A0AAG5DY33_ANOAO